MANAEYSGSRRLSKERSDWCCYELLSGIGEMIDYEQEDKERAEWSLGDYENGDDGCPHCKRMRLCKCDNGMHRCEKCNWCPELNGYAPIKY
jgi:hypothetical protein